MTIPLFAFALGALLLFVGVLGGGFEVKELKIPKVGTGVRLLSGIVGLLFIVLGFTASAEPTHADDKGGHADSTHMEASQQPVDFFLADQLGEDETSEKVTVLIDGKNVGDLNVSQAYPSAKIRVSVPQPGQHSYTAEATAFFNDQGATFEYAGVGQGMIDVRPGKIYSLRGSISGNTWLVSIEEEQ